MRGAETAHRIHHRRCSEEERRRLLPHHPDNHRCSHRHHRRHPQRRRRAVSGWRSCCPLPPPCARSTTVCFFSLRRVAVRQRAGRLGSGLDLLRIFAPWAIRPRHPSVRLKPLAMATVFGMPHAVRVCRLYRRALINVRCVCSRCFDATVILTRAGGSPQAPFAQKNGCPRPAPSPQLSRAPAALRRAHALAPSALADRGDTCVPTGTTRRTMTSSCARGRQSRCAEDPSSRAHHSPAAPPNGTPSHKLPPPPSAPSPPRPLAGPVP
jgi:hypothetical protein